MVKKLFVLVLVLIVVCLGLLSVKEYKDEKREALRNSKQTSSLE